MTEITIETYAMLTASIVALAVWIWMWGVTAKNGALVLLDYAEHNDFGLLVEDALGPLSTGAIAALSGYLAIYHLWPLEGLHMLIFGA